MLLNRRRCGKMKWLLRQRRDRKRKKKKNKLIFHRTHTHILLPRSNSILAYVQRSKPIPCRSFFEKKNWRLFFSFLVPSLVCVCVVIVCVVVYLFDKKSIWSFVAMFFVVVAMSVNLERSMDKWIDIQYRKKATAQDMCDCV